MAGYRSMLAIGAEVAVSPAMTLGLNPSLMSSSPLSPWTPERPGSAAKTLPKDGVPKSAKVS